MVHKNKQKKQRHQQQQPQQQQQCKRAKRCLGNGYKGYRLPSSNISIDRVDVAAITPKEFFNRYVSTRRPCLLQGQPADIQWLAGQRWLNPQYLRRVAGDSIIDVERRKNVSDDFGQGRKVKMSFATLLDRFIDGDESYYMTTQQLRVDDSTCHNVPLGEPLKQLRTDFPLRPSLLSSLIPQQINLWMGAARHGSSTGLHHDFHDNLYVLIAGKKRFRLYAPSDVDSLYVRGRVSCVHANGLINYHGTETRADGISVNGSVWLWDQRVEAERELEAAEVSMDSDRIALAEASLENLIDKAIEACQGDGYENGDLSDTDDDHSKMNNNGETAVVEEGPPPDSFSLLPSLRVLSSPETSKRFPKYAEATPAIVDISAGEMLYLPASWFHEVTSFSAPLKNPPTDLGSDERLPPGVHMALNYWFHPPNTQDFQAPYEDAIWSRLWEYQRYEHDQ